MEDDFRLHFSSDAHVPSGFLLLVVSTTAAPSDGPRAKVLNRACDLYVRSQSLFVFSWIKFRSSNVIFSRFIPRYYCSVTVRSAVTIFPSSLNCLGARNGFLELKALSRKHARILLALHSRPYALFPNR